MGQPATLIIDIETVGQNLEGISPRAREILLDVETDEDRQKVVESFGLDPCTGRIICIGVHWLELERSRAYCQPDERELLANFWSDIGQIRPQRFVTFNGKSFDFPYINIRSAIMGFPFPGTFCSIPAASAPNAHFDVREVLTNFERYRKGTLEFFCEIFGVHVTQKRNQWQQSGRLFPSQGRLDEIAHYCLADCKATADLYQRLKNYYR